MKTGQRFGLQLRRHIPSGFLVLSLMLATVIPLGSLQTDYYAEAQRSQDNEATQPTRYPTMLSMALIGNLNDDTLGSIARVNASFLDLIFYPDRSVDSGTMALNDAERSGLGGSVSARTLLARQVLPPPAVAWESWIAGDRLPIELIGTRDTHEKAVAPPPEQEQPMVALLLARYAQRSGKNRVATLLLNGTP